MRVKLQQALPQGFDDIEPHSWECELYKEDEHGRILVPVNHRNCREKLLKDTKIGDFVAVRLDEKSGKTGTIAGQIVEFIPFKILGEFYSYKLVSESAESLKDALVRGFTTNETFKEMIGEV